MTSLVLEERLKERRATRTSGSTLHSRIGVPLFGCLLVLYSATAFAGFDLVLAPPLTVKPIEPEMDTIVEIEMRIVWDGTLSDPLCSDPSPGEVFQAIDAIITWHPTHLEFLGTDTSTADYAWDIDGVFSGDPDGWNNGNDGDALWQAAVFGQFVAMGGNGKLATVWRFKALSATDNTTVNLLNAPGSINNTDVLNCNFLEVAPGISSASVRLIDCPNMGPDSDGDGFRDACDNCANTPNPTQEDTDDDGAGDACDGCPEDPNKTDPGFCGCSQLETDSDSDGTPDCVDNCPMDPNKTDPGMCGCGIADLDSDTDGTADCNDLCPLDSAKTAPGQCGCGASDIDADADGTADCNDQCPLDPAKTAPGFCGCGVPDTDTDGDVTPDCSDGCPDDPNKIAPGICGCGFSDETDEDTDGVQAITEFR